MTQMSQEVDIVSILRYSVERGASDIVITAGLSPQFKIHGEWGSGEFTQSLNPCPTEGVNIAGIQQHIMQPRHAQTGPEPRRKRQPVLHLRGLPGAFPQPRARL